ncbi:hypothetical protein [Clostridium sp. IBUN22A]|nr:hypothetical protein [Clostridium sp. IBUN22A]
MYLSIKAIGYYFNSTSVSVGIIEIFVGGLIYLVISFAYMVKSKNKLALDIVNKFKSKFIIEKAVR